MQSFDVVLKRLRVVLCESTDSVSKASVRSAIDVYLSMYGFCQAWETYKFGFSTRLSGLSSRAHVGCVSLAQDEGKALSRSVAKAAHRLSTKANCQSVDIGVVPTPPPVPLKYRQVPQAKPCWNWLLFSATVAVMPLVHGILRVLDLADP